MSASSQSTAPGRHRPDLAVAAIAVLALGAAAAVHVLVLPASAIFAAPLRIPWWLLAAGFLAAEVYVIHLPARQSAHTLSLAEVPLVIGLVFSAPAALIAGRLLGAGIGLVLHRRQTPLKLFFNLVTFYAEVVVALGLAYFVSGDQITMVRGWVGALAGVGGATIVGGALVSAAISVYDRSTGVWVQLIQLLAGIGISLMVGVVAVIWAILLWMDTATVVLVVATGLGMYGAVVVFGRLYRRYDELLAVHGFAASIAGSAGGVDEAVERMLELVADRLRVPRVAIVLQRSGEAARVWTGDESEIRRVAGVGGIDGLLTAMARCGHDAACPCGSLPPVTEGPSVAVPVVDHGETVGAVIVQERERPMAALHAPDRLLLSTMAQHFGSVVMRLASNERLQYEVEAKQHLLESKDQLIASVSHEVRTPLTAVLGFAEILRQDSSAMSRADLEHAAAYIAEESTALSHIVEDLLTAARAGMGSLEAHARPTEVLGEVERAVAHLESADGVPVPVRGSDAVAMADPGRVRQIVRNLVSNAHRYGAPPVEVEVTPRAGGVAVRVIDRGEGVPADEIDRVFEPYESAHPAGTQPASVGIGLPISRQLARLMGGELRYRREDGVTVFELILAAVPSRGTTNRSEAGGGAVGGDGASALDAAARPALRLVAGDGGSP